MLHLYTVVYTRPAPEHHTLNFGDKHVLNLLDAGISLWMDMPTALLPD